MSEIKAPALEVVELSTKSEAASLRRRKEANVEDRLFQRSLRVSAWLAIALLISILVMLLKLSGPSIEAFQFKNVLELDWNPGEDRYGILPFIVGTLLSSALALVFAVPVSVAVALFLTEIAPRRIMKPISFLVEMLAAIPSVVYGLWGIYVLAPSMQNFVQPLLEKYLGPGTFFSTSLGAILGTLGLPVAFFSWIFSSAPLDSAKVFEVTNEFSGKLFAGPGYGVGMLTASIVLAIMIVPTIASICREIFNSVSSATREAAIGLGATRWEMIHISVIKTTKSGIFGAIALGLGRALGETMAVTMVIGNRNEITAKLMSPGQTMASLIANEYPEASGLHLSSLASVGVILFGISLLVNGIARSIIWRAERGRGARV